MPSDSTRHIVQVYVGALSAFYEALSVEASKQTTSEEIVSCIVERLFLNENTQYELTEVIGDDFGRECKERSLASTENPVQVMMLWPNSRASDHCSYRFYLREKVNDCTWRDQFVMDPQLIRDYFHRFLYQPKDREYPDLCQLPDLNEQTLLDNLRARFVAGHIYTYVGSILIALNPFKFYPIYNPKYVKLYQNRRFNLPPHIFAVADTAYYCMLKDRKNQCIVISGESGSGKTESTNFLLHHLTALSQKGSHGSGVEQTILSAGPVLEAFGNAKTAHNNNSSRFGKFIQVNYKENGMVHGAVVQKYLLEKSRICSQGSNERNYHVFYYLLEGATEQEKAALHLKSPNQYYYLNKSCYTLENVDESYEFSRLKQSMEMVGFTAEKQRRLFSVLSAVLLLGNVEFQPRKSAYHHDESVAVKNPEIVSLISELLRVKQETLLQALTAKRARASGETLIINYRLPEAIASRDAMAKCLYGALFDWIVLQVNHALLSKKDTLREHQGNSIGVLDIFGFEDFGMFNSFEQLCINYANEHLQYYFNQHVFKYEQEEYRKEGIRWNNIEFMDNTGCLQLIEGKPNGLLCLLDDQCNFPGATNETLLQKFNIVHKENKFYQMPQKRESAFMVVHYAGKVKYQVLDMREKNLDLMRQDIVGVLKNSSMAFVRELVGADPVAVFRWAIVRAFFRSYFAFMESGRKHRQGRVDGNKGNMQQRYPHHRNHTPNDSLIRKNKSFRPRERAKKGLKNLQSVKTLAGRTASCYATSSNSAYNLSGAATGAQNASAANSGGQCLGGSNKVRKQPLTVAAQFQHSLHSLMDTLNQANPFFIRCIKSNANKVPNQFDEDTVQRQLRYTGMLETVRIRQAGFNVRLTYDEFIQLYRILLPKGLLSSQIDVRHFLCTLNLDRDNYQLGGTKVFLRESEKYKLDCKLHQQIMASIVTLQRWFRACLERRRFMRIRSAVITIQSYCRMHLVQQYIKRQQAAIRVQKYWRMYRTRKWYCSFREQFIRLQAHCKGVLMRRWVCQQKLNKQLTFNNTSKDYGDKIMLTALVARRNRLEHQLDNTAFSKFTDSEDSGFFRGSSTVSGFHDDTELPPHSTPNRLSLRSTMSLPAVVTTPSSTSCYSCPPNNRLENTLREGTLLDQTLKRNKLVTQSHRTIDYSVFGDHTSTVGNRRKGSDDSLDSQQSTDSRDSTLRQLSSANLTHYPFDKPDSTTFYRNQMVTKSSPLASSPNTQVWYSESQSRSLPVNESKLSIYDNYTPEEVFQQSPVQTQVSDSLSAHTGHTTVMNKVQLARSPNVLTWTNASGRPRYVADGRPSPPSSNPVCCDTALKSLPPVRRPSRPAFDERISNEHIYCGYDRAPNKAEQILGRPEAPVRTIRKAKRHNLMMKNMLGEETIDSGSATSMHNINLDGISKSKAPPAPHSVPAAAPVVALPKRQRHHVAGPDLRRRNSDPASKTSSASTELEHSISIETTSTNSNGSSGAVTTPKPLASDDMKWQNTNTFSIAGHLFRKVHRIPPKEDMCAYCDGKMDPFITHIYKCSYCKKMFHTKCIQNKSVLQMPCSDSAIISSSNQISDPNNVCAIQNHNTKSTRNRKHRKYSRTPYDLRSKFSLTGTSEFTDRTDQIISGAEELTLMQQFITDKIMKIETDVMSEKPASEVDRLFKLALREFKDNLVQIYSAASKHGGFEACSIRYKDLITNFMQAMETVCQREMKENMKDFPVTMGVNAFRGFMNEFMSARHAEQEKPAKTKRNSKSKEKKQRKVESIKYKGHTFILTIINIPTACEVCNSFFMWPIERGLVCQSCKLTCHKKCHQNASSICVHKDSSASGSNIRRLFGVPLVTLVSDSKIPLVIERLLRTIELYGLYTEGIYRKSGVSSKIKELKCRMDDDAGTIDFEKYQVHVLASVLKCFLREMPEPLLTFECYENFITASNMNDGPDRVATLYDILKKLPQPNYDLMERLMFHLARVALHEEVNRMSAESLAIVFAPCVLRTNKVVPAQDSLQDIGCQTRCIETIIREQLRKVRSTLEDINTLDTACQAATNRLSSLRSSKVFSPDELSQAARSHQQQQMYQQAQYHDMGNAIQQQISQHHSPDFVPKNKRSDSTGECSVADDDEEHILVDHIQEIQKEKEHLTSTLPTLTHATLSDDDMLSTDGDGSLDDISCIGAVTKGMSCGGNVPPSRPPLPVVVRSLSSGMMAKVRRQLSSEDSSSSSVGYVASIGKDTVSVTNDDCEDPIMV